MRLTFEVLDLLDLLVQMLLCPSLHLLQLRAELLVLAAHLPVLKKKLFVQPSSGGEATLQKKQNECTKEMSDVRKVV